MKEVGKENAAASTARSSPRRRCGPRARRRSGKSIAAGRCKDVMEEIEDEIKEHFGEHQLKFEMIQIMQDELNDLSGANKPVEVKLFGPDYSELRHLAEEVGEMLEKKGKGRGIKEVNSNVFAGNPDLMVQVDGAWAAPRPDAGGRRAAAAGDVPRPGRHPGARIGPAHHRRPRPLSRRAPLRPGPVRRRTCSCDQWILLPEGRAAEQLAGLATIPPLAGPARAVPLSAVATAGARPHPRRAAPREPAAGHHRHRRAERGRGRPGLGRGRHPPLDGARSTCRRAIAGSWAAITSSSRKRFAACSSSWSWPCCWCSSCSPSSSARWCCRC